VAVSTARLSNDADRPKAALQRVKRLPDLPFRKPSFFQTHHASSVVVGASLFTTNSIALCADSMPARGLKHSKHAAASSRHDTATAQKLHPIRSGFPSA
jgi:hypothetical protein